MILFIMMLEFGINIHKKDDEYGIKKLYKTYYNNKRRKNA